jgi:4-hydroxy-tetrahydrodipicolinate synthase
MKSLNRQTHRGLWAAVPTPWKHDLQLDETALAANCRRLAQAGADGIYTTDSDGEFYAIEIDEFQQLARAFARAMTPLNCDAAMGVTWSNTRGTIDRIRAACDAGVVNVHVAFPMFMPLAGDDVDRFFDDLAQAAPEARWIHYAHPRCEPVLTGRDYARLAERFDEQLIGTKLAQTNIVELTEVLMRSPQLAHLVVDTTMAPGMMMGAVGCCSYWFNTLPGWHRRFADACVNGRWDEAMAYHRKLIEWELTYVTPLRAAGHRHGIIAKARGALTGFLDDSGMTRPPYRPVDAALFDQLKSAFDQYWAQELAAETIHEMR